MPGSTWVAQMLLKYKDEATPGLMKTKAGTLQAAEGMGTMGAAGRLAAAGVGAMAAATTFGTVKLALWGATADKGYKQLGSLVGGYDKAQEVMNVAAAATGNLASKQELLPSVMRLVNMGLIKNADDTEKVIGLTGKMAGIAVKTVPEAIEALTNSLMSGRTQGLRPYGIDTEKLNDRMKELAAQYPEMSRQQRMWMAIQEQMGDVMSKGGQKVWTFNLAMQAMKNAATDAAMDMSLKLVPALDGFARMLQTVFPQVTGAIAAAINLVVPAWTKAMDEITKAVQIFITSGALNNILQFVGTFAAAVWALIGNVLPPLMVLGSAIINAVLPPLSRLLELVTPIANLIGAVLTPIVGVLVAVLNVLGPILYMIVDRFVNLAASIINALLPAITILGGYIVQAANIMTPALGRVIMAVLDLVFTILSILIPGFGTMSSTATGVANSVGPTFVRIAEFVATMANKIADWLYKVRDWFNAHRDQIERVVRPVWEGLSGAIQRACILISSIVGGLFLILQGHFSEGVRMIGSGFGQAFGGIGTTVQDAFQGKINPAALLGLGLMLLLFKTNAFGIGGIVTGLFGNLLGITNTGMSGMGVMMNDGGQANAITMGLGASRASALFLIGIGAMTGNLGLVLTGVLKLLTSGMQGQAMASFMGGQQMAHNYNIGGPAQFGPFMASGMAAAHNAASWAWNGIHTLFTTAGSVLSTIVQAGLSAVQWVWQAGVTAWGWIVNTAFPAIHAAVAAGVSWLGNIVSMGLGAVQWVWQLGVNAWGWVVNTAFPAIHAAISAGVSWIGSIVSMGLGAVQWVWQLGVNAWSWIVSTAFPAIHAAISWGVSWIGSIVSGGLGAVQWIWQLGVNAWSWVVSTAFPAIHAAISWGVGTIQWLVQAGLAAVQWVWQLGVSAWGWIVSTAFPAIHAAISWGVGTIQWLVQAGLAAAQWVWQAGISAWGWIVNTAFPAIHAAISWGVNAIQWLVQAGLNAVQWIWQAGVAAWGWVVNTAFPAIHAAISWGVNALQGIISAGLAAAQWVWQAGVSAWGWIVSSVFPAIHSAVSWGLQALQPIVSGGMSALSGVFQWGSGLINNIWTGLLNFLPAGMSGALAALPGGATAGLAILGGAVAVGVGAINGDWGRAWENIKGVVRDSWPEIQNIAQVGGTLLQAGQQVIQALLRGDWNSAWAGIQVIADAAWPFIQEVARVGGRILGEIIRNVLATILSGWGIDWDTAKRWVDDAWNAIKQIIDWAMGIIKGIVSGGLEVVRGTIGFFSSLFKGDWQGCWDNIKMIVDGAWKAIDSILNVGFGIIDQSLGRWLRSMGINVDLSWGNIKRVIGATINTIYANVVDTWNQIAWWCEDKWIAMKETAHNTWIGIANAITTVQNGILSGVESFVNFFIDAYNWIATKIGLGAQPKFSIGGKGALMSNVGYGRPARPGPVGDVIPGVGRLAKGGWGSGLTLVGEKGPELVNLPGRSFVFNNDQLKQMASASGMGNPRAMGGLWDDVKSTFQNIANWAMDKFDFVADFISRPVDVVVDEALKAVGFNSPNWPGIMQPWPGAILKRVKDALINTVKSWFAGIQAQFNSYYGDISGAPYADLIRRFFPADQWLNAYRVMMGESRGNAGAIGDHGSSIGLFQIRHDLPGRPSRQQLLDPGFNVAYAAQLWRSEGWMPWTVARQLGLVPGAKLPGNVAWLLQLGLPAARATAGAMGATRNPYWSAYGWGAPTSGSITNTSHPGYSAIDIGAPLGTPIRAVAAARVAQAGWGGAYGNMVVLQHLAGGLSTLYAHMSQILVGVGQMVGTGQVIGLMGSTGNSTGSHLHFEVRSADRGANFIARGDTLLWTHSGEHVIVKPARRRNEAAGGGQEGATYNYNLEYKAYREEPSRQDATRAMRELEMLARIRRR